MAHHVSRRRTPSPPLTRFTPVHIIAPEKPSRPWQNRSRGPSQVEASSPRGHLKTAVTSRENPHVARVDNNSQAHWLGQGRQPEMERELQLQEEREVGRHREKEREMERERQKREERLPEKGRGGRWAARGEQAELSFNARNRKGPASRGAAPTSRDTGHSYSERPLQQQQSPPRAASQPDGGGGVLGRRRPPPAPHNHSGGAVNGPCRSSGSSMGSELDEVDDEGKWLTDSSLRSLSSPEPDYLDMYNSSCRSSTDVSRSSTRESPAGGGGAWPAYADFRGSAPRLDNEEPPPGLDPSRRIEMGSFECVDVAVDREDCRRVRRGVPKRQIQLKRRSHSEGKPEESSANSSPGLPGMVGSPSPESFSRETLTRQHSTPEAAPQRQERKLQKSVSLDETCTKTKMATCIIKSVLSKKMQGVDEQPEERAGEEGSAESDEPKESPQPDSHHRRSSEGLPAGAEPRTQEESRPPKSLGARSGNGPSEAADPHAAASLRSDARSESRAPFERKRSTGAAPRAADGGGMQGGDSADAAAGNSGAPSATGDGSVPVRATGGGRECDRRLQPAHRHTQEVTLRAVEKKKASLNVCLTPEAQHKPSGLKRERLEAGEDQKTEEEEEGNGNSNAKVPIHKVRDVRRLVKHTYNLSFKATSDEPPSRGDGERMDSSHRDRREEITDERREEFPREEREERPLMRREEVREPKRTPVSPQCKPMQIHYKAVCWKEDKNKTEPPGLKAPAAEKQLVTQRSHATSPRHGAADKTPGTPESNEGRAAALKADRKPPLLGSLPKLPSKDREVSTAVVLIRDGSSQNEMSAQEETPPLLQGPAAAHSPGPTSPTSHASGHSVSTLLKEKGYQADIGAVNKGLPRKHVNCLEVPLRPTSPARGGRPEPRRERTFSSSSPSNTDSLAQARGDEGKQSAAPPTPPPAMLREHGDFEAVKRLDPTVPPRFPPQAIEVKSVSKETPKPETHVSANSIEVQSVAKASQKPAVAPKPSCKFKPADSGAVPSEAPRAPGEERPQTIVVSSPTVYRTLSNESTSSYTRKLAVSAVSSLKPPACKATATPISGLSTQPEASGVRGQRPGASPQRSTAVATAPGPASDPEPNRVPGPESAVLDPEGHARYPRSPRSPHPPERATPVSPNSAKPPAAPVLLGYRGSPCSRRCSPRPEDLLFDASDDPPSYDERESFSPLLLPDLSPGRSTRYRSSPRPPPCSCTAGCPSHPGPPPPQRHRSPHSLSPPAPPPSPGQASPYSVAPPPLRLHQPMSYQPGSPKSSPLGPGQPPAASQPLHQPPPGVPPHQTCPANRPLYPPQHMDPRRPPVHRSPQQHPPGVAGAPGHGHSPGLPPMDPQYLCGPQSLGPAYGSEYGGDSSSLYSDGSYGQTPRRVLMDPETGKYFYIEVPVQPLRKMLFDPETGQYVEVLIPQQAVSHPGLYPPAAAPYSSLHSPNMYAAAPQYMPYAAPPPQAHPQPPRYPEASVAAAMHHAGGPGVHYRNPPGPTKPDPQSHAPLDQSYLDGVYYVPTGMSASPTATPPDYYHQHPPSLPPAGGKRS